MIEPPPTAIDDEFAAYVRARGPLTFTTCVEWCRLANMHDTDPISTACRYLKRALDTKTIALYRDTNNAVYYAAPGLRRLLPLRPPRPIQPGLPTKTTNQETPL